MSIILYLIVGAVSGAGGLWYYQKRKAGNGPGVKPQGGGGPGEEQGP